MFLLNPVYSVPFWGVMFWFFVNYWVLICLSYHPIISGDLHQLLYNWLDFIRSVLKVVKKKFPAYENTFITINTSTQLMQIVIWFRFRGFFLFCHDTIFKEVSATLVTLITINVWNVIIVITQIVCKVSATLINMITV